MSLFTLVSQQYQKLRQLQRREARGEEDVREALRVARDLSVVAHEVERARDTVVKILEALQERVAGQAAARVERLGPGRGRAALPGLPVAAGLAAEAGAQVRAAAIGAALRRERERGAAGWVATEARLRELCEEFGVQW